MVNAMYSDEHFSSESSNLRSTVISAADDVKRHIQVMTERRCAYRNRDCYLALYEVASLRPPSILYGPTP